MKFEFNREPEDSECGAGMLVGVDGCHYRTAQEAFHISVLGMCGCGLPVESFNFLKAVAACFDRRAKGEWLNAEKAVTELVKADPEIVAHVLAHVLSHLDVLEHGGGVGGSWLTDKGAALVDLADATEEDFED